MSAQEIYDELVDLSREAEHNGEGLDPAGVAYNAGYVAALDMAIEIVEAYLED